MRSERGRLVEELFERAAHVDRAERAAWLDRETGGDASLRAEVESLLVHSDGSDSFLGEPLLSPAQLEAPVPPRIGPFRIVELLGEGGMGRVYLAEQDAPRRQVALKVLRSGLPTARDVRRFEHEAEILARLHHPGIAQVYEAGNADAGAGLVPYIAMELVHGPTLVAHAIEGRLTTRDRLGLVAEVCDALDHAHRRGIVHRDIKPSNVLVDSSSGAPRIKVLDFGIARAIDPEARPTEAFTLTGQVVGTLAYMSPEQALAGSGGVDARSDVYSLGVLAYELVCGRLPLELRDVPLHEALRMVREVDPTTPSKIAPELVGDVDTILAKALEKDPERRYDSAAGLASDLRAMLADRPILARPASRAYTLRKFARRNRALVAGLFAVFVALTLGLATTTWQAWRASNERDRANLEALHALEEARRAELESRRARAVASFQRATLARVQPGKDGREVRLASVLDAAAAALPGDLAGDPASEGGVHKTLGDSYHALGLLDLAETQFRLARDLFVRGLGESHEESIDALAWLGTTVADLGRLDESIAILERAHADASAHLPVRASTRLVVEMTLAQLYVLVGREVDAETLARANVARRTEVLGADHIETLDGIGMLADIRMRMGHAVEAEELLRRVVEGHARARGPEHPMTLTSTSMLAVAIQQQGRFDEPEVLYRRVLEVGARVLGADHVELQAVRNNLALLLEGKGQVDEAEVLLRAARQATKVALGEGHPESVYTLNSLVMLLARSGRIEAARTELDAARAALLARGDGSESVLAELGARLDALR